MSVHASVPFTTRTGVVGAQIVCRLGMVGRQDERRGWRGQGPVDVHVAASAIMA